MSKKSPMGFEHLHSKTIEVVVDQLLSLENFAKGESPIEKLFHAALLMRVQFGGSDFEVLTAVDPAHAERLRAHSYSKRTLIVETQVPVLDYRLDFVVSCWTEGPVYVGGTTIQHGLPRWRKLVVECDGHEFHERTKEQAAKDRSRDRALVTEGYEVFRFTGSELWRDPWACAEQVHDWAERGFDVLWYVP